MTAQKGGFLKRYYGEEAEIIPAEELEKMKAGWPDAIARILAEGPEDPPAVVPVFLLPEAV